MRFSSFACEGRSEADTRAARTRWMSVVSRMANIPPRCAQRRARGTARPLSFRRGRSCAAGIGRQVRRIDSDQRYRGVPAVVQRRLEKDAIVGVHREPRVVAQFLFQLTRTPARVTQGHEYPWRTFAVGHGGEDV